jgi:hypothetical protein
MGIITALGGRVYRDRRGVWRHTDTDHPIPGARDMTLSWAYPDLVIIGGRAPDALVLVPDELVRDNEDLAWVREVSDGPTSRFDRQRSRGHGGTPGWSNVWPVPAAEWDKRDREPIGIVVDGWDVSQEIPRGWTYSDIADYLGVAAATVRKYAAAGRLPAPDDQLGGSPLWRSDKIIAWHAERPGHGGRPRKS